MKQNRVKLLRHQIIYLLLFVMVIFGGCEEEEIVFINDADILRDYISQTEEGRDLFRVDNLIVEDSFAIDSDPATYEIVLDSVFRSIVVDVTPVRILKDFGGSVGFARDAEVIVDDFFYLRVLRIENNDTTIASHKRVITRIGYFLKLGSDAQANFGWLLWGFNGGAPESPAQMLIRSNRGVEFRGDALDYVQFRYVLQDTLANGEIRLVAGFSDHKYVRLAEDRANQRR